MEAIRRFAISASLRSEVQGPAKKTSCRSATSRRPSRASRRSSTRRRSPRSRESPDCRRQRRRYCLARTIPSATSAASSPTPQSSDDLRLRNSRLDTGTSTATPMAKYAIEPTILTNADPVITCASGRIDQAVERSMRIERRHQEGAFNSSGDDDQPTAAPAQLAPLPLGHRDASGLMQGSPLASVCNDLEEQSLTAASWSWAVLKVDRRR